MQWSSKVLTVFTVSSISRVRKEVMLKFTGAITAIPDQLQGEGPRIVIKCKNHEMTPQVDAFLQIH